MNFFCPFQLLCTKVRLDKVDPLYLHHPKCRINSKDETRIKMTSQELEEWLKEDGESVICSFVLLEPEDVMFSYFYSSIMHLIKMMILHPGCSASSDRPVNFHTECWYMTLYAHHLSIMPTIRKYQRRAR